MKYCLNNTKTDQSGPHRRKESRVRRSLAPWRLDGAQLLNLETESEVGVQRRGFFMNDRFAREQEKRDVYVVGPLMFLLTQAVNVYVVASNERSHW